MKSRNILYLCLTCAALPTACFKTEVINASPDEQAGGTSGFTGAGGVGNPGGGSSFTSKACTECEKANCANEYERCQASAACDDYYACLFDCGTDANCLARCTAGPDAIATATDLAACAVQQCTSACSGSAGAPGAMGGKSGSGGGAPGGGSSGHGGAGSGGKASFGGATSSGGKASFGGAPGSGGEPNAGITWLTFDKNNAPPTLAPNGDFGIQASLYAYSDTCATLTWDDATRCATGMLCAPGPDFANWGAAVGFDFYYTGENGTPPNSKLTWNPVEHGVRGIAWEISGTAPALQLWVLNMDPAYHGVCSEKSCDIAGPPDGTATPQLAGQLLFSNMRKDDWGGSGIVYTFDPAAVHALQFKLPAVIAGAAPFSFCVNRIGFVR